MLDPESIAPERLHRFTREEYEQLIGTGVFEGKRLELLYGMLVDMTPQYSPHAYAVAELTEYLIGALRGRAKVRCQLPIIGVQESEPEPDIAVVPVGKYSEEHPREAFLIVEVADASAQKDLGVKARLYAEMNVPECWVIHLKRRRLIRHRNPRRGKYVEVTECPRTARVSPRAFPDVEVELSKLIR